MAEGVDLLEGAEGADLGVHRQPRLGQQLQGLGMAGETGAALDGAHLVGEHRELPAGGDLGVLLAQGAGARIAGIGEQAQAGLALALVELLEGGDRHVHLAPHLEH